MAQKINQNLFKLKKRLNWDILLCSHNFIDYSNLIKKANKISYVTSKIQNLNVNIGNKTITKNSKIFRINVKMLDQRFFTFFSSSCFPNFVLIQSILLFEYLFINQKQLKTSISRLKQSENSLLMPNIFNQFFKIQLQDIGNKNSVFSNNLQSNILLFIREFFINFNYNVIGFKILCSGKWTKTSTGRKQNLYIKKGQIRASNISNKVFYYSTSQKTRHGICSIKIWITHS